MTKEQQEKMDLIALAYKAHGKGVDVVALLRDILAKKLDLEPEIIQKVGRLTRKQKQTLEAFLDKYIKEKTEIEDRRVNDGLDKKAKARAK